MELFRREALLAAQSHHLGTIRLARPITFAVASGAAIALTLALALFASFGEVTRKSALPGILVPTGGVLQVAAPQNGRLVEVFVREGHAVTVDQPLARIEADRRTADGNASERVAHTLRQRRESLEAEKRLRQLTARQVDEAIATRASNTSAQLSQATTELELVRRRASMAVRTQERFEVLAKERFVADIQSQQRQEEAMEQQARAQAAERTVLALKRDLAALHAERRAAELQLQSDLAQVDRALLALDQEAVEHEVKREALVTAASNGVVSAIVASQGQTIQAGQTVATVTPLIQKDGLREAAPLRAQMYASSRSIGFIRVGQAIRLRFAAFPYQKFGMGHGRISNVTRTPILPKDLPAGHAAALLAGTRSNEALYRVDVDLDSQHITTYGTPQPLRAGMAFDGDVLQDRRAVWEWLFEPLLAASARVR